MHMPSIESSAAQSNRVSVLRQEKSSTSFNLPADSFTNVCHQYLEDHDHRPSGPGAFVYGMSLLLGQTFTRRLSNLVSCVGLKPFYPAQREYPILSPCNEMAARFQPNLFTINKNIVLSGIRYEILPPQEDKNYYSIVYFVEMPTEKLPIPVLGKLYDWARPVLFGSKRDWEAIQIDIDKNNLEPIGIGFETANYTNSPDSFDIVSRKDLHLFAKLSKMPDGTWMHTVQQKNGKVQTGEIPDPFRESSHANIAVVSWNGSFDLCDRVARNPDLKLSPLETPEAKFMDIDTYRREGIDLRMTWLNKRRLGKYIKRLPVRSASVDPASSVERPMRPPAFPVPSSLA